jgi:UDP-N-acetylmuramate dehydrogenase
MDNVFRSGLPLVVCKYLITRNPQPLTRNDLAPFRYNMINMTIEENRSLKNYNTFGIRAAAKYFAGFSSVEELKEVLADKRSAGPQLVLGGGSNILLTGNFNGIVLKNEISGIEQVKEDDEYCYVKAGAGEHWHRFVLYCLQHELAGVENLSLIPGNVGASPMQNIGAYGVEIKNVFHSLEAYHIHDRTTATFNAADCKFGYRESIFKHQYKGQFVISSVTFRLRKKPVYHTEYGAILQELEQMGVQQLNIRAISQAVINIRTAKLPDPAIIGNAGSFFKNPAVPLAKFEALQKEFPAIVGYPVNDRETKLAAGWLIEQCGWKGYREGDAGCHAKQALVLVNYGNASGEQVFALSEKIIRSVNETFGVLLQREINII